MSVKQGFAGLLVVLSLALAGPQQAWASPGGGHGGGGGGGHGGGGFGGGGSSHSSSFGGSSFHSSSFGSSYHGSVGGIHSYSAPSISHGYSAPSISHGTMGTPLHTYTGSIHSGSGVSAPLMHNFSGSTLRGGNLGGLSANHGVNPQNWQRNGNWEHGNQFAGRSFDHGFDHRGFFGGFYPFYGFGGLGFYDPFLWGWGSYYGGYGYGYPDYGYGYGPSYAYYNYGPNYGYSDNGSYSAAGPVDMTGYAAPSDMSDYAAPVTENPPAADAATSSADWGHQFIDSARQAFLQRQYADALRLASHASVEMPKDAKIHELTALALFALKDYRGANMEAHAALSIAPAADWPTLYGYYKDLPTYEHQLNDLAAYIRAHPDAADARFVLAYHDLMLGDKAAAKIQFEKVLGKVPQDELAVTLLKSVGGTPPSNTAQGLPGKVRAGTVSQPAAAEKVILAPPSP